MSHFFELLVKVALSVTLDYALEEREWSELSEMPAVRRVGMNLPKDESVHVFMPCAQIRLLIVRQVSLLYLSMNAASMIQEASGTTSSTQRQRQTASRSA